MKKILMIAPSSFPVTGAEAIVNIKLLNALSDSQQFKIDLISRRRKWEHYPSDTLDSYNVQLNNHTIVEVDNVINLSTIFQTILTYLKFGILFRGYHWVYPAWRVARKLVKTNEYDYVLTKDAPSLVIGYWLQKRYKVKWVASWNDPHPSIMYPKPYGSGVDAELKKMHKRIIGMMKSADVHIFPNLRLLRYMNSYLHIKDRKCIVVPHVIIPSLSLQEHEYTHKLRLIHSGNLSSPRDPSTFLYALRKFLDNRPYAEISFTILGSCDAKTLNLIDYLHLSDYVNYLKPVEYKSSLKLLSSYDVAVIIEADCEEGIFLPTKVSDFMQMSIPIFAVSPQIGVLNDLYSERIIPYFASVRDTGSILSQFELIYDDFKMKQLRGLKSYPDDMSVGGVVQKYLSI